MRRIAERLRRGFRKVGESVSVVFHLLLRRLRGRSSKQQQSITANPQESSQSSKTARSYRRSTRKPLPGHTYNPLSKWPRNAKCPCGTGKKFKVCCGLKIREICTEREAQTMKPLIDYANQTFRETGEVPDIGIRKPNVES